MMDQASQSSTSGADGLSADHQALAVQLLNTLDLDASSDVEQFGNATIAELKSTMSQIAQEILAFDGTPVHRSVDSLLALLDQVDFQILQKSIVARVIYLFRSRSHLARLAKLHGEFDAHSAVLARGHAALEDAPYKLQHLADELSIGSVVMDGAERQLNDPARAVDPIWLQGQLARVEERRNLFQVLAANIQLQQATINSITVVYDRLDALIKLLMSNVFPVWREHMRAVSSISQLIFVQRAVTQDNTHKLADANEQLQDLNAALVELEAAIAEAKTSLGN